MKTESASDFLPPGVAGRLDRLTAQDRRSGRLEYMARVAGFFILLAMAAMAVDGIFRIFHPVVRWLISLLVLGGLFAAGIRWGRRLRTRNSTMAAARTVEESMPELQERWSTLASLGAERNPLLRGSPGLIAKVREEAEQLESRVPRRRLRTGKVKAGTLAWAAAGCGALLVFQAADPGRAGVLWHRLLAPWSDASLTRIEVISHPAKAVVPRHEACELQAAVSGRTVRSAVLFLDQGGTVSEIPLSADQLAAVPFKYLMRDPVEDFSFRFRAGDGQTVWHQVRVADRPVIQAASVTVTPPAYTGQQPEKYPGIPQKLRALMGSQITVRIAPGRAGDRVWLQVEREGPGSRRLAAVPVEGQYAAVSLTVTESGRFFPVIVSAEGLENRMPPVCGLEALVDQPPVVTLAEDSAGEAFTPSDTIEVAFSASDDVGIQQAEVVVTLRKKGSPPTELTVPVDLGKDQGARSINRRIPLDLSKLALEPDADISYAVRVQDGKAASAEAARKAEEGLADGSGEEKPGDGQAGKQGKDKPAGAPEPPVTMGKRQLDLAGQCSCSGSKNLEIEGYTGESPAFRDKKSLPVLPILAKIKEAAVAALQLTTEARGRMKGGRAEAPLIPGIREAEARTKSAAGQAEAFTRLTKETPYAMIGLDLESLRTRDFVPAENSLTAIPGAADAVPETDLAAMHLRSAVAWLERLMLKAEAAARAEAAAELAQKVKEMHRIFLEDSMALLKLAEGKAGEAPGLPLIEVSQEYAKLLEKKEKAMAEIMRQFAELLAKDPALMAKFTINRSKGADALQVQVASLAMEQKALNLQTGSLASADAGVTAKTAADLKNQLTVRQGLLVEELGGLMRSAVAWFPKTISRETTEAAAFFDALLKAASLPPADDKGRLKAVNETIQALDGIGRLNGGALWSAKQRAALTDIRLRQEWLGEFAEAVAAGRASRPVELLQRDLERRTRVLAAKIGLRLKSFAAVSGELRKTTEEISSAFSATAIPGQTAAAETLRKGRWAAVAAPQDKAFQGLESASRGCARMIDQLAQEMRKNPPPPPDPREIGGPMSLESLLAMMESEAGNEEEFSLPEWKLNVQLMSDWLSQCKKGSSGAASGARSPEAGDKPDPAMDEKLRAAAEQARNLAAAAAKVQQAANAKAEALAAEGLSDGKTSAAVATRIRREDWNRLPSSLNKDLRQQNDTPPPEEYRHAVETYFRRIGAGQEGGGG